jgi:hypothetical protein
MSSKPTVYFLGCYHQLQEHLSVSSGQSDGEKYSTALHERIKAVDITFIGEEAGEMHDTLARRAATGNIQYANLDIPLQAKKLIRYVREEEQVLNKEGTAFVFLETFPEYRNAWGLVREYHMYKTFVEESASHSNKLLICGLKHVAGLKRLLAESHDIQDITPVYQHCTFPLKSKNPPL